jgi:3'(2'),5'-bisphosphate nucleotidase
MRSPLSPIDYRHVSLVMQEAARAGGRVAMAVYGTHFAVECKSDGSPVSEADRRAERIIVARLSEAFPDVPIVAEEEASTAGAPVVASRFFLVDPLDGTKEFIARNGEFTVNIALIENGVPVAGVVVAPALDVVYVGVVGEGASKGSQDREGPGTMTAIRTRPCRNPPVALASRSHLTPATDSVLRRAGIGECRTIGSSLKFCLLAEGAADFYPRLGPTMEWDTAAGDAVLRAAGGLVVQLDGKPLRYGRTRSAGGCDFENPHFLALGDPDRIAWFLPNTAA